MIEVVAALIRDGEKFLLCQRPAHKARGMQWEFVGGKVEPGESRAEALVRECREELGVTIAVKRECMELTHVYPDITVHLTLLEAVIAEGSPRKLEHNDIRWIRMAEADDYDFCPADREILERLREGSVRRKDARAMDSSAKRRETEAEQAGALRLPENETPYKQDL